MQPYNLRSRKKITKCNMSVTTSQYQVIGIRDEQEDFMYVGTIGKYRTLCIITDGHNGDQCSKFVIEFVKQAIHKLSTKYKDMKRLFQIVVRAAHDAWAIHILGDATYRSPKTVIERNHVLETIIPNLGKTYQNKGGKSGTTLVCVMIDSQTHQICFCNLGDSRAVMFKNEILYATKDHSVPKKLTYLEGTEFNQFQTKVVDTIPRINGDLSVAGVIGDYTHSLLGFLKSEPDINLFALDEDAVIILGSDGLWNTLDCQKLFINPLKDAKDVITQCHDVSDNTSAILIFCKILS